MENENKEIVERYYAEVISGRDYSNLSTFVAADYVDHNAEDTGRRPEIVRNHMEAIRTTLPDFSMHVEQICRRRRVGRDSGLGSGYASRGVDEHQAHWTRDSSEGNQPRSASGRQNCRTLGRSGHHQHALPNGVKSIRQHTRLNHRIARMPPRALFCVNCRKIPITLIAGS